MTLFQCLDIMYIQDKEREREHTMITATTKITPGTILEGDFGYSMTLPAFYEVVAITPSGKSAKVRRLRTANKTSDGGWTGTCVPVPGSAEGESTETKRIKIAAWDRRNPYEYVMIRDHMFSPWNGKAAYFDHWD